MQSAILFDIDGTLLYARGVGRAAFGAAFHAAYGVPYPHLTELVFVGATDSNLVRSMAAVCGVNSTPAREEHFFCTWLKPLTPLCTKINRTFTRACRHSSNA